MSRKVFPFLFLIGVSLASRNDLLFAADKPTDDFIQTIVILIGDQDPEFRAAGLEQVRLSAKGTAATKLFADQLTKLDPAGQMALANALADRGDTAALPAVIQLFANSDNDRVRATAVVAIGRLGSTGDLPMIFKSLSANSGIEQNGARQALAQIAGNSINKKIAAESVSASPHVRSALLEVLATRRASEELPLLVSATTDDNGQVRSAAMSALGQIGRPEQIAPILPGVLKAQKGGERDNAERSVAMICSRIDNEDQRATALIEAIDTIPAAERDELLPLAGRVGGGKLINYVADIARKADPARRQLAIDALSKWPDSSVADILLEIVTQATEPAERRQAFQGYIKVCASRDNRSDKQRLDRMKDAMKIAKTPEEQTLVINRTRTAYDVDSVRFVQPYMDQPQLAEIACETIVEIAHHREVRDPNKAEFDKLLDKVIETTKDPVIIDRAQRYKKGETWERPKK